MKQNDYPGGILNAGNAPNEGRPETMPDTSGQISSEAETIGGEAIGTDGKERTVLMGSGMQSVLADEGGKSTSDAGSQATRPDKNRGETAKTHRHWREQGFVPGDVFQGKYEIIRLLGVGGMGRVYEARHRELEATVALKIMAGHLTHQPEAVERFKREARAMARVQHPHAVRVLDAGLDEGCLYLVMEFLAGQTLREWHHGFRRRDKSPPLTRIWQYTGEVLSVLEFMHRRQIAHRDLKPDNIFLARDMDGKESVKVLDFGIAKIRGGAMVGMTVEGLMMGTPGYMSPEQCLGKDVDGRSDLYSMGVVLYELLSGSLPFRGSDPIAVAMKHVHEIPVPLRELNPAVPPAVAQVVHRALEKSPEKRFQTAMEFWDSLEKAAGLENPGGKYQTGSENVWVPGQEPWVKRVEKGDYYESGSRFPVRSSSDLWQSPWALTTGAEKVDSPATTASAGGRTQPVGAATSARIRRGDGKEIAVPGGWRARIRWGRLVLLLSGLAMAGVLMVKMVGLMSRHIPEVMVTQKQNQPAELPGFVFIPGGEFVMGRNPGRETVDEIQRAGGKIPDDETPSHPVRVEDFHLSRHETTNAEYREFILATGHPAPAGWKGNEFPPGQGGFPVTGVSWNDARDYCAWLTKTRGQGVVFRLPTEAEWEYAARGKDGRIFPWGNFWREGMANTGQAMGKRQTLLLPVDVEPNNTRDRSAMGIMGMGGNVCEWTASQFDLYPGSSYRPAGKDRECRVYRGGHFASPVHEATCTSRKWTLPDRRSEFVGFRVAAGWKSTAKNQTPEVDRSVDHRKADRITGWMSFFTFHW